MPENHRSTRGDGEVESADERTPLLLNGDAGNDGPDKQIPERSSPDENAAVASQEEQEEKPMQYLQVLLLCYASLTDPIAYFGIFPFINEMIERTGNIPETSVGFWSGLLESMFSLVQMLLMIVYGRFADRLGRKPVLVFSLTGVALSTALFGMAHELWQMFLFRCLAGVFAGSSVTIRTMISENCTKSTQGRAFSWFMFVRNMGILIGPLIGGGLANPAVNFAGAFDTPFWRQYPYALSSFVCGAVSLTAVASSAIFLKETLVRGKDGDESRKKEMSTWQVLTSPGVPMVLYIFSHVMFTSLTYTAVSTVFMYTDIKLGGFGFSDPEIGLFMAIVGASQAGWMLLLFPYLQRRFGTGPLLRACCCFFPVFMAMYPILNEFLRNRWRTAFWVVAPITVVLGSGVSMAFACVQLMVNDISPSAKVMGTMNALALTANNGIRAFAPILGTSIFAAGIKWGKLDGHLIWIVLVIIGVALAIGSWFTPKAAEGLPQPSPKPSSRDSDDS